MPAAQPPTAWFEPIVQNYMVRAQTPLMQVSRQDSIPDEWLLDRIESTDTARYFIFQIGQSVSEADGTEPRFVANSWIYLDSLSRKVYELDIALDSLMEWQSH